jgi:hypothetical protein
MITTKQYSIPVLFVVFNRPEIALKSFKAIKKISPHRLYIASDAPRETVPNEKELVEETRNKILREIDWDCEIHTLFQEKNLGCGLGVYTAISWLFEHEECGIILEDDCVVNNSFFAYMEELLTRYATDDRIGMIAGTNPLLQFDSKNSYIFSKYKSCWGWASWRRAWKNMELDMDWRIHEYESVLKNAGYCAKDYNGWRYKIKCIDKNIVSAWDWQWYFSLSANNQLCIYPIKNLVSNIGTDANATHTSGGEITLENFSLVFPLQHPQYVVPNYQFDKLFYKKSNTMIIKFKRLIPISLKKKLKKIIVKLKK